MFIDSINNIKRSSIFFKNLGLNGYYVLSLALDQELNSRQAGDKRVKKLDKFISGRSHHGCVTLLPAGIGCCPTTHRTTR
jgi:hypothetical protein